MGKPFYQTFDMPDGLQEEVLSLLEAVASGKGAIRRGTNEATKSVERNKAKLVLIALDVDPAEIVGHIPMLCKEKKIPYVFISTKEAIGKSAGMKIGTAACAIQEAGGAQTTLDKLATRIRELAGV